jgi:TM2 domain-containing membrane protein YozV
VLSALVLPGLGHIYLKRYLRGLVIMLVLAAGAALLLSVAIRDAFALAARIQFQAEIVDVETVLAMALDTYAANAPVYRGCIVYIATVWLFSLLDTWRIGGRASHASDTPAGTGALPST